MSNNINAAYINGITLAGVCEDENLLINIKINTILLISFGQAIYLLNYIEILCSFIAELEA